MSENGELISLVRARAILKCGYPQLKGYEDAGELEAIEEDGKKMYRLSDVQAVAESKSDIEASIADSVGQVTRMIRGFERHTQELLKLAIDPVKMTLGQWEKLNTVNADIRKSLEDENQRLRDKYHAVLIKLEEMLDGDARRKVEEEQMRMGERRKDELLQFLTEKAGPTIIGQVNRTIGLKTKAQPLLDLVDRMSPEQIGVLLQMGLVDKIQAEALCTIKGIKLEDIKNENVEVSGTSHQESSDG